VNRTKIRSLIAGTLLLMVILPAQASLAQSAQSLYKAGVKAFKEGKYLEASAAFRKANEAKPSWKLQYNIGQCEAAAKRHGLALSAFEVYLSRGGDDIPADRRDEVLAEVERLRKMVGRVQVMAPEGALVFMDGVKQGTAPLLGKIPVAASVDHEIWAVQNRTELKRRKFRVSGGDTVTIDINPQAGAASPPIPAPKLSPAADPEKPLTSGASSDGPSPASPATETDPLPDPGGSQQHLATTTTASPTKKLTIAGWTLTGSGAALLIGGAITGGLAMGKDSDLSKQCEGSSCPGNSDGDIKSLDNLAMVTNLLLGVGAAAAITGAVLLIVAAKKEKKQAAELALTPVWSPNFGGLAIEGRF